MRKGQRESDDCKCLVSSRLHLESSRQEPTVFLQDRMVELWALPHRLDLGDMEGGMVSNRLRDRPLGGGSVGARVWTQVVNTERGQGVC